MHLRTRSARTLVTAAIAAAFLVGCVSAPAGVRGTDPPAALVAAPAPSLPANGDPAPRDMALATDSTYGYSRDNPIKVGGAKAEQGPQNERAFLDVLLGPHAEAVRYTRQGSCCRFKTSNALVMNVGLLDVYEVSYDGAAQPRILYINMYDYEVPRIPVGFTRAP